jgi:hypothetical protein
MAASQDKPRSTRPIVFVSFAEKDKPSAASFSRILNQFDLDATLEIHVPEPERQRAHRESNIGYSDAVVFVYGAEDVEKVRDSILDGRAIITNLASTSSRAEVVGAILDAPPEEKPDLDLMFARWQTMICRKGIQEDEVKPFIDSLRKGSR